MSWYCKIDLAQGVVLSEKSTALALSRYAGGRLSLWGDGRLDNLGYLRHKWGLSNDAPAAQVLAEGYLRHASGFVDVLLGDFSFLIYDHAQRTAWLVRDHIGIRPLYYRFNGDVLEASDSLQPLLSVSNALVINQDVMAEWCLRMRVRNQRQTFFQALLKLPRATTLEISPRGMREHVYWDPMREAVDPDKRSDGELEDALHDLLRNAVQTRLADSRSSLGAHNSGGLDSSPLAMMTAAFAHARGLTCFSYNWCRPTTPDEAPVHEWQDARLVAEAAQMPHREIGATARSLRRIIATHDPSRMGAAMFEYETDVVRHAGSAGVSHIVSGYGGDEFLTGRWAQWHLPALRAGKFLSVWRQMASERAPGRRFDFARRVARIVRDTTQAWRGSSAIPLSPVDFRERVARGFAPGLVLQPEPQQPENRKMTLAQRHAQMLSNGYHQERIESWAALGEPYGVRHVYPLLDKRIVEFALAMPARCYVRHGEHRYLYRRALGDALPEWLRKKTKPKEMYRVTQLMQAQLDVCRDADFQDEIAARHSRFIDTAAVVAACRNLPDRLPQDFGDIAPIVQAVKAAAMALNVEAGCGVANGQA